MEVLHIRREIYQVAIDRTTTTKHEEENVGILWAATGTLSSKREPGAEVRPSEEVSASSSRHQVLAPGSRLGLYYARTAVSHFNNLLRSTLSHMSLLLKIKPHVECIF